MENPTRYKLNKDTVYNWFSRYENTADDHKNSNHFPTQKNTQKTALTTDLEPHLKPLQLTTQVEL